MTYCWLNIKKSFNGLLILILVLSAMSHSYAQVNDKKYFGVKEFIEQVKQFHPVARQAGILVSMAEAELLTAKGSFDPVFDLDISRKTFDGKNYYNYANPELKIPLPVGDLKTGLENNGGDYLSSEITKGKSSYLGMELPLARGLVTDKRRTFLRQAKIYLEQSEQEKLQMLNNLLFEAYTSYWQWAGSYELFRIYSGFAEVADKRLRLVKIAFQNGDRSVMDTVEAYTQLQNYRLSMTEAQIRLSNASLELSNFLWQENNTALQLPENSIPDTITGQSLNTLPDSGELIEQSSLANPILLSYNYKLKALALDKKLKAQNLLPYFSIKTNLLYKEYNLLKNIDPVYIQNNYKWGLSVKLPLFLREERGSYQKSKLKLKETELALQLKKQEISNKINAYSYESKQLATQLLNTKRLYENYALLLRNEELKFSQGESSLFLINSREMKLAELMLKQTELTIKYQKALYATEWAAGMLK